MNEAYYYVQLAHIRHQRVTKEINLLKELLVNGVTNTKLEAIIRDNWNTDEEVAC